MSNTLNYILKKLNETKVETIPFEHFVIYDFLPTKIYNELTDANSKLNLDNIEKIEIAGEGMFSPTTKNIHKASTITYNLHKCFSVHEKIYSLFTNTKVQEAILKKYNITNVNNYIGTPELLRDIDIDMCPHTDDYIKGNDRAVLEEYLVDSKGVLAHFQLYCPLNNVHSNLGVNLLEMIKPNYENMYDSKMQIIKHIPYIPNLIWSIKPGPDSWHMVDPIKNLSTYNRDSITMRLEII